MSDRRRAWQYMGKETPGLGSWVESPGSASRWERFGPGDHYIATEPLTPDDIPLAPPVEVTAEDWIAVQPGVSVLLAYELAEAMTERLAARQEAE